METFFASPRKASPEELSLMVTSVNENAILNSLLQIVDGCLAILNEQRQILAVNTSLLRMLGIEDQANAIGLRPGEAIGCVHASKKPHGCGTTEYCSTCGAAIAMVTSLAKNLPVETTCAIRMDGDRESTDLYFRVRSQPLELNYQNFILLFIQDITRHQQWAAIERVFFHDINNIINGLSNASELLAMDQPDNALVNMIGKFSAQLVSEVRMQQYLNKTGIIDFKPILEEVRPEQVLEESRQTLSGSNALKNKHLLVEKDIPATTFRSNLPIVSRVMTNMILNALEASGDGDTVRTWATLDGHNIHFHAWNRQTIPRDIAKRIFQRNFSTKAEMGRGWGTYSMKLFGEKILNGKVDFTSTESGGTTFRLSLPLYEQGFRTH